MPFTAFALIIVPTSDGNACQLTLSYEVFHKKTMQVIINFKKNYDRAQQNVNVFDKLNKCSKDILIDKKHYECSYIF